MTWMDERQIENDAAEKVRSLRVERDKLRDAIRRAGFQVCQTSGDWTLHDVSEYGKKEEARSLEVATRNVDLELQVERLTRQVGRLCPESRMVIRAALIELLPGTRRPTEIADEIISRLAAHDPPILLEMQAPKTEHAMDEAPVMHCNCRMCESARFAKM